ncbi:nudix hydrolase 10-like isoform X3 [Benincasa hispida]|uniref:nudix hydrolase 10-like isoform X3 n=1 Tax=Benincasa hispida TaxID=102211 RepID=UPI0019028635|nr:nudix hydrolase 10-like isoform X3 [Benincasa hispida]
MIRSLFFSSTFVRTTFTSFTPRFTPIPVLRCPGIGVGNSASFCSKSFSVSAKSTFFMEQAPTADEVQQVELLDATEDNHGGVIVEMDKPMDCEIFAPILRASIAHWKKQGKKGVWIKLPIELAHLVEAIVKERFWYHHAEPKYLMLVYWIPEGAHTLPVNATHRVGIGAFVLNDKKELKQSGLAIRMKRVECSEGLVYGSFPQELWMRGKIYAKLQREKSEKRLVFMLLQIDTEFVEVLAFRQTHQAFFGKSDLFFVCMLKPLTSEISKQELEIEDAQWMKLEDYTAQPLIQKHEVLKYINNICVTKIEKQYSGFSPVLTSTAFSSKRNFLYLNEYDLNRR